MNKDATLPVQRIIITSVTFANSAENIRATLTDTVFISTLRTFDKLTLNKALANSLRRIIRS